MSYLTFSVAYVGFIAFLAWLRRPVANDGLIDLGWPLGLLLLSAYFFFVDPDWSPHRYLLCGMYAVCGCRFVGGWVQRVIKDGEDHRWALWRDVWREKGANFALGSRNVDLNFFVFYQLQALANVLILYKPLALAAQNRSQELTPMEIGAGCLWLVSLICENIADYQLYRFRQGQVKAPVLNYGLWRYSRHPNYFCELLLWLSYALAAVSSAQSSVDLLQLALVPTVAYIFLRYFTGVPVTEAASLVKRGAAYAEYQRTTNVFFPGRQRH